MAGYTIAKKLLIKDNQRVAILNPPSAYRANLKALSGDARVIATPRGPADNVLLFAASSSDLTRFAARVQTLVGKDSIFWVAYPKKSSGVKTDLSRDTGWDPLIQSGFEGVALVSIDDTWSAMRFRPAEKVKRTSPRRAAASRLRLIGIGGASAAQSEKVGGEVLRARTGKTWSEWFTVLDKLKAHEWTHTRIAAYLHEKFGLPGWWCQSVTVGYEQAKGLRVKHETCNGFEVSVSRVIGVPISELYGAFAIDKVRAKWLPGEKIKITTATTDKSMRILWSDGQTRLSVGFYPKGKDRAQLAVQHLKLPDSQAAAEKKAYWAKRLDGLKALLESGVRPKN